MPLIDDKSVLNLKTVVYATDLSPCSRNAGLYAARMAACFSAKLLVAHAFTLSQAALEVEVGDHKVSQQRIGLKRLLSNEALSLKMDAMEPTPTLLEGDPKDAISQLAERNGPSMIVLGTHGGNRLERGIIGSVGRRSYGQLVGPRLPLVRRSRRSLRGLFHLRGFYLPPTLHLLRQAQQFMRWP